MVKRIIPFISLLALSLLLAACGNTAPTTTGSAGGVTPTTAPTAASSSVVSTATASVAGKSETILTDAKGMTLYYFTPDTATTSACTGGCATAWPPLLFTGSGTPTSASSLSGTLSTVVDANGTQVAYNGHLLYTFASDTAAGQTSGQGVSGKWFVATPDLAAGSGSASTSSAIIKTAVATVAGKSETILTDAKGLTLYFFTPDTTTTSSCTGGCATAWPPLLFTGSGTPTSASKLSGTLSTASSGNGNQVEYNGHLLYTFASDTAAGQVNGQGVSGKWFVVTPSVSVMTAAPAASSSNGY
jgi:predicted lipoprotein with Yx(FWY)xxD motif